MDCANRRLFNYRKSLLPNNYLAMLERGVTNIEMAKKKTGFSIGYPGWNLLYYSLLCSMDSVNENIIIETGTNWGCSTIVLAQALKDSGLKGHVYTVDIDPKSIKKAKFNIKKAKLTNYVTIACDDSIMFLKKLIKEVGRITFAFLDGCHLESHVIREFSLIHPKLTNTGLVFFDNISYVKSPGRGRRVYGAPGKIMNEFGGNILNFENVSWSTPGQAIWQKIQ